MSRADAVATAGTMTVSDVNGVTAADAELSRAAPRSGRVRDDRSRPVETRHETDADRGRAADRHVDGSGAGGYAPAITGAAARNEGATGGDGTDEHGRASSGGTGSQAGLSSV